jgi:hypothetical protein
VDSWTWDWRTCRLAACFDKLWDSGCAWHLLRQFAAPQDIANAGLAGLCRSLDTAPVRYQRPTADAPFLPPAPPQTEPVKRAVAVKVIKAGMDSKAMLVRFEAERSPSSPTSGCWEPGVPCSQCYCTVSVIVNGSPKMP